MDLNYYFCINKFSALRINFLFIFKFPRTTYLEMQSIVQFSNQSQVKYQNKHS